MPYSKSTMPGWLSAGTKRQSETGDEVRSPKKARHRPERAAEVRFCGWRVQVQRVFSPSLPSNGSNISLPGRTIKSLPLGHQSFANLRSDNNYVDKMPFIKAVMEYDAQVLLIPRPRRFGKTIFMDTLQRFLDKDVAGNSFELAYKAIANRLCALADQYAFYTRCPFSRAAFESVNKLPTK